MLFVIFAASAIAVMIGSTACTRRGAAGPPPAPTATPITGYYVDPVKGKDTNNGSQTSPFKTITKALEAVKKSVTTGLTITLNGGAYTRGTGEVFPIVIPTGVTLTGIDYGHAVVKGAFINGAGEDTTLEKAEGTPSSHTLYATVVVPSGVSLTFDKIYVGTTVSTSRGSYASVDVLGSLLANSDTFGQGKTFAANGGVTVAGGTLSCNACVVYGNDFAIKAYTVTGSGSGSGSGSSSSGGGSPSITLSGPGHSVIGGGDGIRTDGTATVTASSQVFQSRNNAYIDSLTAPTAGPDSASPSPSPTGSGSSSSSSGSSGGESVDFGYGAQGSLGGNTFVSHSATEVNITRAGVQVLARNNTWNIIATGPQKTNDSGQYQKTETFRPGTDGRNVKIAGNAAGSTVTVGPGKPPTPTPSPYASGSPSASPSTSPTASPT
jgi:hypothetical protein